MLSTLSSISPLLLSLETRNTVVTVITRPKFPEVKAITFEFLCQTEAKSFLSIFNKRNWQSKVLNGRFSFASDRRVNIKFCPTKETIKSLNSVFVVGFDLSSKCNYLLCLSTERDIEIPKRTSTSKVNRIIEI